MNKLVQFDKNFDLANFNQNFVSCSWEYCGKNCWWLRKKKSTLLLTPYDLGEQISSVWQKFRPCKFQSKFCILQLRILRQKLLMAKKKKSTLLLTPYDLGEQISSVWQKFRSCKFRSKFRILQFRILRQKLLMAERKKEFVIINPLWPRWTN